MPVLQPGDPDNNRNYYELHIDVAGAVDRADRGAGDDVLERAVAEFGGQHHA